MLGPKQLGPTWQCGITETSIPTAVIGLPEPAIQVSAGQFHTCALVISGGVWCWGDGSFGELGIGPRPRHSIIPRQVRNLPAPVSRVSAGDGTTCAVTTEGAALCWGYNGSGQVGDGTRRTRRLPTPVAGLDSNVADISTNGWHSCALLNTTQVMCWGSNISGELGLGHNRDQTRPRLVAGDHHAIAISVGSDHTCLIDENTLAHCWGSGVFGELGIGSFRSHNVPVQLPDLSGISQIDLGQSHSCALLIDGELRCWGLNDEGQLGNGSTRERNQPVRVRIAVRDQPLAISAGASGTCAVVNNGQVRCWGWNFYGQIGNGTDGRRVLRPTRVSGGRVSWTGIRALAALPVPEGFDEGLIRLRAVYEGSPGYARSRSPITELQVE
ncbi:hypothetical protein [Pararhodobacter sp. CCB-MM2]|uniref:RCC1 domain-containing protein n=1 Tax=Pararhodobacter sp. CCB-MM2 TaxID=1786003 RepID=UPI0009F651B1|nr:hypothetical protein [Pararhodobacter sp. CCB-MM2]